MQKLFFLSILFITLSQSCKDPHSKNNSPLAKSDNKISNNLLYQEEQEQLTRKRNLCNRLALYDIEKGTQNFELRVWQIPSMWDPSILYILKANDSSWTLFHYQYYTLRCTDINHYYDNPVIDSVVMESLKPQKISWSNYIKNLYLDNLWGLQTESAIEGKQFIIDDGARYLVELSDKGKYKYLYLTQPDYFQDKDINHKKFVEFQKRLIDPVIYNGIHNP